MLVEVENVAAVAKDEVGDSANQAAPVRIRRKLIWLSASKDGSWVCCFVDVAIERAMKRTESSFTCHF